MTSQDHRARLIDIKRLSAEDRVKQTARTLARERFRQGTVVEQDALNLALGGHGVKAIVRFTGISSESARLIVVGY
jgi:hypothetical protein